MPFWTTGDQITQAKIRASAQLPQPLGGDFNFRQVDAAFAPVFGHAVIEIDGTDLPASSFEAHLMAMVDGGTGQVRLWNITAGGIVGAAINVTETSPTLKKIQNLTLAAGLNQYRLEALKGTTWIAVWGARFLPEYA